MHIHELDETKYADNVCEVADALRIKYRDFAHHNRRNPLDELLFIICSTKTTGVSSRNTYRRFRCSFPKFSDIARSSIEDLARALSSGGLQNIKAKSIKSLFSVIEGRFGRPTLSPLAKFTDEECEEFITSLPGVGKKVARCVMLYSLDRKVFPVDTHCWRISKRIGWIKTSSPQSTCTSKYMDALQDAIPHELRFSLHVNMVSLGRDVCTFNKPKCGLCPIQSFCEKNGV